MTVLLCGVISGLFAFFILGLRNYLNRHKKSNAWIDLFYNK